MPDDDDAQTQPNPDPEFDVGPELAAPANARGKAELVPRAGLPILSCGSADPIVPTLFAILADLGFETPTSRGENPHGVVGAEELAAVRSWRRANDIHDDPAAFGGDSDEGRRNADNHIGPWTIEALLRTAAA